MSSDTLVPSSVNPGLLFSFKTAMFLYRPRLRYLSSFSGALLPNFHMIVKREFLII